MSEKLPWSLDEERMKSLAELAALSSVQFTSRLDSLAQLLQELEYNPEEPLPEELKIWLALNSGGEELLSLLVGQFKNGTNWTTAQIMMSVREKSLRKTVYFLGCSEELMAGINLWSSLLFYAYGFKHRRSMARSPFGGSAQFSLNSYHLYETRSTLDLKMLGLKHLVEESPLFDVLVIYGLASRNMELSLELSKLQLDFCKQITALPERLKRAKGDRRG